MLVNIRAFTLAVWMVPRFLEFKGACLALAKPKP